MWRVYNSIDGKGMLFNAKDIISGRKDADTIGVNLAICDQRILPETTVQRVTIAGEDEQHQKERKNYPLCIYHGDINTPEYHKAVYAIALGMTLNIHRYSMILTNRGSAGDCELAGQERNQHMMPSLSAYGVQGRNLALHFSVNDTRIGKNWRSRSKHFTLNLLSISLVIPCVRYYCCND